MSVIPPLARHVPAMEEGTEREFCFLVNKVLGCGSEPYIGTELAATLPRHWGSYGEYLRWCLGSQSEWLRKEPRCSIGEAQPRC